jgi:hypothetical protein
MEITMQPTANYGRKHTQESWLSRSNGKVNGPTFPGEAYVSVPECTGVCMLEIQFFSPATSGLTLPLLGFILCSYLSAH